MSMGCKQFTNQSIVAGGMWWTSRTCTFCLLLKIVQTAGVSKQVDSSEKQDFFPATVPSLLLTAIDAHQMMQCYTMAQQPQQSLKIMVDGVGRAGANVMSHSSFNIKNVKDLSFPFNSISEYTTVLHLHVRIVKMFFHPQTRPQGFVLGTVTFFISLGFCLRSVTFIFCATDV